MKQTTTNELRALKRVVKLCGGQTALARRLGIAQGSVAGWLVRDGRVGAQHALGCHRAVEGKVTVHQLRPDLYPKGVVRVE